MKIRRKQGRRKYWSSLFILGQWSQNAERNLRVYTWVSVNRVWYCSDKHWFCLQSASPPVRTIDNTGQLLWIYVYSLHFRRPQNRVAWFTMMNVLRGQTHRNGSRESYELHSSKHRISIFTCRSCRLFTSVDQKVTGLRLIICTLFNDIDSVERYM